MDKIRENIFGIGVGLSALIFLVLLYFLVIDPILAMTGDGDETAKTTLDTVNKRLKLYADRTKHPNLPSKELEKMERGNQKQLAEAIKEAEEFYKIQAEEFNNFPDAFAGTKDQPANFKATYTTEIANLKTEYLKVFPRGAAASPEGAPPEGSGKPGEVKPAEAKPAEVKPAETAAEVKKDKSPDALNVQVIEEINDEEVPRAMKEFLIIRKVFQTAHKLKLGGLQAVEFPNRTAKEAASPSPLYKIIESRLTIELPPAALEPFVAELLDKSSPESTVPSPFLFKSLSMYRKSDNLLKKQLIEKTYENEEAAKKDDLLGGEPPVVAEINLWAIEWQGLPKEEPKKDAKTGPDTKKPPKPPKK